MNLSLATAKKERPASNGGFSNDNTNWLKKLTVGAVFYCKWKCNTPSHHVRQFRKAWEQGPVVRLEEELINTQKTDTRFVDSDDFIKLHDLVHVEEEDTG